MFSLIYLALSCNTKNIYTKTQHCQIFEFVYLKSIIYLSFMDDYGFRAADYVPHDALSFHTKHGKWAG